MGVFMNKKRIISIILMWVIVLTSIPVISYEAQAKTKEPMLSNKKVVVKKGNTKTIKLKNARKKVQWKVVSGRKNVKIIKKFGKYQNKIKLKARRKGNAVLVAVHGKKIYTLKVMVKEKGMVLPESTVKTKEELTTKEEETTKVEQTTEEVAYAKVTFLGIDENIVCTMEYQKGKTYGAFPRLYDENYLFLGWHMESDIGKRVKEDDVCMGDITLYAKFVRLGPTIEPIYEIVEE